MAGDSLVDGQCSDNSSRSSSGSESSSSEAEVALCMMDHIRKGLRANGFSEEAIELVERSIGATSTGDRHWRLYSEWCIPRGFDPVEKNQ